MSDTRNLNPDALGDLYEALRNYRSQFGQALEAYGIPFGAAQEAADKAARAALARARGEG